MALQDPMKGHIDVALSTYAQRFENTGFMADQIFPRVNAGSQSGKYFIFGRENLQGASDDDTRAPGAPAKLIKRSLSTDAFFCPDHSIADVIPDEERGNSDSYDPEQESTRVMMDQILLRHDKRVANIVSDTTNYPAANTVTLSGTSQWDSGDVAATPVDDVLAGRQQIILGVALRPNILVLGADVFKSLQSNAQIIDRIKHTKLGPVDESDLASLFRVARVVVWETIERSEAGVNSFIFAKDALLIYTTPTPGLRDVSFGKTFVWVNAPGTVGGFQVARGRAPEVSQKADQLSTHFYHDEKQTANEASYLIKDAVS